MGLALDCSRALVSFHISILTDGAGLLYRYTKAKSHHLITYVLPSPMFLVFCLWSATARSTSLCRIHRQHLWLRFLSRMSSPRPTQIVPHHSAVDRLLLLLYRIRPLLANTPLLTMPHRGNPRNWLVIDARKPEVRVVLTTDGVSSHPQVVNRYG